jgi:hypothetical protein
MKTAVVAVALACLAPGLGFAASLTGSNVVSSATVNLSTVGTLDWARWPGYSHKGTAISNVTTTGWLKSYTGDPRIIGDSSGIKTGGVGASFTFTVAATTVERTLTYYIGGWNSTGKITVTLPGATTYTTTFSSSTTFSRVITVKFRADSAATLRHLHADGRQRQHQDASRSVVAGGELNDTDLATAGVELRRLAADRPRCVQGLLGNDSGHLLAIDEDLERHGPHLYRKRAHERHMVLRRDGAELEGCREPVLERLE